MVGQTHKRPGVVSRSQGEDIWIIALCSPSLFTYWPCGIGRNGPSSRHIREKGLADLNVESSANVF